VVPNGLADLPQEERRRGEGAEGGGGASDAPRLLFLSNMHEAKGPLVLLDAVPIIRAAVPGVRVTFAGGWPDPMTRDRFLSRVRELGVEDAVDVRGPVEEEAKRALLREASLLAFPTYYPLECAPLVVVEAMRQSLPVVATRHAGIPEMVGDAGELVPVQDPAALGGAVAGLLLDPERARRLGRAGRDRYEHHFSARHWERGIVQVLVAAAGQGGFGS
jgi:glycosyltransferase involved in cell wall biosynthesis